MSNKMVPVVYLLGIFGVVTVAACLTTWLFGDEVATMWSIPIGLVIGYIGANLYADRMGW